MRSIQKAVLATFLTLATAALSTLASAERPQNARSCREFQSPDTRALEADEAANPAYLWLEEGKALWRAATGHDGQSCQTCHGDAPTALAGVAVRYPRIDPSSDRLVNIEGRINSCRTKHQKAAPWPYESPELLSMTLLIANSSRGLSRQVSISGAAAPHFARGQSLWTTRQGQLDLACSQCHDENVGRQLRGDRISQGQSDGWPAYRLEWQTLGSLHRRLRACSLGVRAEIFDYGSDEYLALELYLAWRAGDLPMSAPGIRR